MPQYIFENIETGEVREIFFKMNDEKIYLGENGDEKGVWERRFTVPQASIDTKISCDSKIEFLRKTENKRGTLGSLWDMSKKLSDERANRSDTGIDPLKKKVLDKWKGKNKNKLHPSEVTKIKDIKIE